MVDQATLDRMLSSLRRYVTVLRQLAVLPRERFLADADKVGNAKYHFVIAIECAIDIANHVIASENYRFPKDNADSFVVLVEEGVIAAELRDRLREMARFRNRLVHLYWEVDDPRVWEYLQAPLEDIETFARAIAGHAW